MKRRLGFVSNSSSSSFIISEDLDITKCKCCGMSYVKLKDIIEHLEYQTTLQDSEILLDTGSENFADVYTYIEENFFFEKKEIEEIIRNFKNKLKGKNTEKIIIISADKRDVFLEKAVLNSPNLFICKISN